MPPIYAFNKYPSTKKKKHTHTEPRREDKKMYSIPVINSLLATQQFIIVRQVNNTQMHNEFEEMFVKYFFRQRDGKMK